MADLTKAVKEYLHTILNGRRYCPRCMGYLPKHEDDCALGKLAQVYEQVKNDNAK